MAAAARAMMEMMNCLIQKLELVGFEGVKVVGSLDEKLMEWMISERSMELWNTMPFLYPCLCFLFVLSDIFLSKSLPQWLLRWLTRPSACKFAFSIEVSETLRGSASRELVRETSV